MGGKAEKNMAHFVLALIIIFSVTAAMLYLASKGSEIQLTRDEIAEIVKTCPKVVVKISGTLRSDKHGDGEDRGRSQGHNLL